jgi:hypothetical protein
MEQSHLNRSIELNGKALYMHENAHRLIRIKISTVKLKIDMIMDFRIIKAPT